MTPNIQVFNKKSGKKSTFCRMCKGTNLKKFLDLGFHPPSDRFLSKKELKEPEEFFPLDVFVCSDCGLMQLEYIVSPQILYRQHYPYESSTTLGGRKHFYKMAQDIYREYALGQKSFVIDVGSNVGLLLSGFKEQGMRVLGIDPAPQIAEIANRNGIETIPEFFSSKIAHSIVRKKGKADVITATNVFAHIDDLDDFMEGVRVLLKPKGILVIEAPHALEFIKNLEYDTIYHEHLSYLAVKPLKKFFEKFGMSLFDVKRFDIHGGSLRYFVGRKGAYPISPRVNKFIKLEEGERIFSLGRLRRFAKGVETHRKKLLKLLERLKKNGNRIAGISAPAKGNTLLNYCGIDNKILDYITEKSKIKIGLYTPGTHIAISPDSQLLRQKPDYGLILAWNFAEEIMANNDEFKKQGGKFIVPIPEPKVI
jgi:SAM-dependent methyltransferase